jgi:serine/threonine protein kinase/WD40 repeat protein
MVFGTNSPRPSCLQDTNEIPEEEMENPSEEMIACPECGGPLAGGVTEGLCAKCLMVQGVRLASTLLATEDPLYSGLPCDFGDYELLEEIARGGMGVIYRARQKSLDRLVAVKLLLFGPQASPEYVKRFRAEAAAAASLQHPNIVAIHQVGVHDGEHYLAMDLVDGPNLARFLKEQALPARRAASYLKTIAEAIHYAHERGILHRDLKPSNVLIDSNDQPRVTDFGLAKRLEGDSSMTLSAHVLGSPSYMPPEQAGDTRHKVGRRSDVYALGAMLYHTLVGRPPFVGEGLSQTLDQVFNRDPIAPRLLNPSVPRDLETICLKCLEKEPARRYPTAEALADELGRFLDQKPILARPVNTVEIVWRWCRRKPVLAALVVLVQVVAGAGLTGIVWQWRRAEGRRVESEQNLYVANVYRANEALEADDMAGAHVSLRAVDSSPVQQSMRGWEWRYIAGRTRGDYLTELEKRETPVWGVAASADGKYLASLGEDGRVSLWDFTNRRLINQWLAHAGGTNPAGSNPCALAFTADGGTLITDGADEILRLWDLPSGRKRSEVGKIGATADRLVISPTRGLLARVGLNSGWVHLLDMSHDPPAHLSAWNSGVALPWDAAFAPDGLTLFVGGPTAQSVRCFDISDATRPRRLPDLEDSDAPVAVSPDGRWLATARANCQPFRLWALPSLTPVATNSVRGSRLAALKFSPDSQVLALGLEDGRIVLWNMSASCELCTLLGHERFITQLDFSPDGRTLASACLDKTVRLWDTTAGVHSKWSFSLSGSAHDIGFSPDSKRLVSVCQTTVKSGTNEPQRLCITQLWEVDAQKGLIPGAANTNLARGLNFHAGFSPDGTLAMVGVYNTLSFLSVPTLMPAAKAGSRCPCWEPGGRWLLYVDATGDKIVRSVSPLETGRVLAAPGGISALALSPDGRMVASCGSITRWDIQLWDADNGKPMSAPLKGHQGFVSYLGFSPDAKTLVSAGWEDGWLGIWDISRRRQRAVLQGHHGSVYAAAFSPDGVTLATCGSDDAVRLWNFALLREVTVLQGHRGPVNGVAFSADGRWLASASSDGTIRLWSAPTFQEIAGVGKDREQTP